MPKHAGIVDIRVVREAASIERVLEDYGVELKRVGQQLAGCCPVHKGSNPRAFVVNATTGLWHCFGDCARGGDVIALVSLIESVPAPEAARLIAHRLGIAAERQRTPARGRRMTMADSKNSPAFKVFCVEGEGDEAYWTRVGSAWGHKDGKGYNVVLSALPVNGRLVLREPSEEEDAQPTRGARKK